MPRSPCVTRSVYEMVIKYKAYDRNEMDIVEGTIHTDRTNMSTRQVIKAVESTNPALSVVDFKRVKVAVKYKMPLKTFLQYAEKIEQ